MNKLEIDFYKELGLPMPMTCGLVNKIISPKGIRKLNDRDVYEYHLKDELIQIYDDKPTTVEPGLYWVMDIFKWKSEMTWNHYLVVLRMIAFTPKQNSLAVMTVHGSNRLYLI